MSVNKPAQENKPNQTLRLTIHASQLNQTTLKADTIALARTFDEFKALVGGDQEANKVNFNNKKGQYVADSKDNDLLITYNNKDKIIQVQGEDALVVVLKLVYAFVVKNQKDVFIKFDEQEGDKPLLDDYQAQSYQTFRGSHLSQHVFCSNFPQEHIEAVKEAAKRRHEVLSMLSTEENFNSLIQTNSRKKQQGEKQLNKFVAQFPKEIQTYVSELVDGILETPAHLRTVGFKELFDAALTCNEKSLALTLIPTLSQDETIISLDERVQANECAVEDEIYNKLLENKLELTKGADNLSFEKTLRHKVLVDLIASHPNKAADEIALPFTIHNDELETLLNCAIELGQQALPVITAIIKHKGTYKASTLQQLLSLECFRNAIKDKEISFNSANDKYIAAQLLVQTCEMYDALTTEILFDIVSEASTKGGSDEEAAVLMSLNKVKILAAKDARRELTGSLQFELTPERAALLAKRFLVRQDQRIDKDMADILLLAENSIEHADTEEGILHKLDADIAFVLLRVASKRCAEPEQLEILANQCDFSQRTDSEQESCLIAAGTSSSEPYEKGCVMETLLTLEGLSDDAKVATAKKLVEMEPCFATDVLMFDDESGVLQFFQAEHTVESAVDQQESETEMTENEASESESAEHDDAEAENASEVEQIAVFSARINQENFRVIKYVVDRIVSSKAGDNNSQLIRKWDNGDHELNETCLINLTDSIIHSDIEHDDKLKLAAKLRTVSANVSRDDAFTHLFAVSESPVEDRETNRENVIATLRNVSNYMQVLASHEQGEDNIDPAFRFAVGLLSVLQQYQDKLINYKPKGWGSKAKAKNQPGDTRAVNSSHLLNNACAILAKRSKFEAERTSALAAIRNMPGGDLKDRMQAKLQEFA